MWDILHGAAFLADASGIALDPLVRPLTQLLPCSYCRDSFNEFYAALGAPQTGLGSVWVYEAHKLVTRKLCNQRIDAFLKKHAADWTAIAVEALRANQLELIAEPSYEVVQKRFMVNRDEPLTWKALSVVLLAFVMGLEVLTTPMDQQYSALAAFLDAIHEILTVAQQCGDLQDHVRSLWTKSIQGPKRAPPAALREFVETLKYSRVCKAQRKDPKHYSRLIKAGACLNGTCQ